MAAQEIAKGKYIAMEGQPLDAIHIIATGSVKAQFPGGEIILKKGDVIGLCDIAFDSHFFSYSTLETSSFLSFPLKTKNSIRDLAKSNSEIAHMMYSSMINQALLVLTNYAKEKESCSALFTAISDFYEKYVSFCSKNNIISRSLPTLESLAKMSLDEDLPEWMVGYYAAFHDFPNELRNNLSEKSAYLQGFLSRTSEDIHSVFSVLEAMNDYRTEQGSIFLNESEMDLFDLFTTLLFRLKQDSADAKEISTIIEDLLSFAKKEPGVDCDIYASRVSMYRSKLQGIGPDASQQKEAAPTVLSEELTGSFDTIMAYADMDTSFANAFKSNLNRYRKLTDKASTEDDARKLRMELTRDFYLVYKEAFMRSLRDYNIPTVLKMFFNFGYMDEDLAGKENAAYLFEISKTYAGDPTYGVYTAYEWLRAIYDRKKDPSRNEFDTDFLAFIHEQKVTGKISADAETQLANSPEERLNFEFENMFPMVNKVTFGRLSSFCPIFSEHNVIKPLPSCLLTVDTVIETIKKIEEVDYGAFYRETIYQNEKAGITKEFVAVKIMPDVILTPNMGTRGVMWQEIEGRKRTTPARFVISALHLEDLQTTFTRLIGEYRWEMCKRVQGARWNDISDRSLTSEYFDYVQFYRKNNDLSSDAKEKVKQSLVKAKNSFKEMFVRDYILWVQFEGAGSPRLNKVSRTIMCTYCPFPQSIRKKLAANPLFKELLEHYEVKTQQKIHHYDNVITKLKSSNVPIPDELVIHKRYIEGI